MRSLFIIKTDNYQVKIFSLFRDNIITLITSTRVAFFIDLETNEIFVTSTKKRNEK